MEFVISIPDPVHNYIRLTELEKTVIDLPKFQRLKGIKQLGVASVVFPGALHTRFEHSLGTLKVADLIFDRFSNDFDEIDRKKVRLAGLLHDIGHSAFSHTIELGLRRMENMVKPRYDDHESYTRSIVGNLAKSNFMKKALRKAGINEDANTFFKKIGHIATGKRKDLDNKDKFLSSIISGEIDADRIDYLIRDGLHTGINFVGFDLQYILENISKDDFKLALGNKGIARSFEELTSIHLGEAFLIARYHYYSHIINHPRNLAANTMLIKALERTLRKLLNETDTKTVKKELDKFYYEYDDNDLLNFIQKNGDSKAIDLISKLKLGKILECSCDFKASALNPKEIFNFELLNQNPILIDAIERKINQLIVRQNNPLYIGVPSIGGVPKNLRTKICGEYRFLYDESQLAASLVMEILRSNSFHIYCDSSTNDQNIIKQVRENWQDIMQIIETEIDSVRKSNPIRLELILLFFYKFLEIIFEFKEPIPFITWIYKIIEDIQNNYNVAFGYKFNKDYEFLYSPDLFVDIMKLGAMGLLRITIEEGQRPISEYGNKNRIYDYIHTRNFIYYIFYDTPVGKDLCKKLEEKYPEYTQFLYDNIPKLYQAHYIS